jgi:hypothetical protein
MATAVDSSQALPALQLCSGAEGYIQAMHLMPAEELIVRNCISRYAMPNTFFGVLKWLVFRTTNAFNKVRGKMSEWKKAQDVIYTHSLVIAIQKGILEQWPTQFDGRQAKIRDIVCDHTSCKAYSLLSLCLNAQDRRTSAQDIAHSLQANDLHSYMNNELAPAVNRAYQKASREFIRMF